MGGKCPFGYSGAAFERRKRTKSLGLPHREAGVFHSICWHFRYFSYLCTQNQNKKENGTSRRHCKTESKIIVIRDIQVILDRDVAELYGVETKAINQAVKRNIEKFPPEYMFQLSKEEKQEVVTKCDHLGNLRYSRTLPNAFTEQGLYMLATILKSPIATETTFAIIDTFTKLRKLARTMAKLNDEAEQGIVPDEAEQGKLQGMMNEVFADKLR